MEVSVVAVASIGLVHTRVGTRKLVTGVGRDHKSVDEVVLEIFGQVRLSLP